MDYVAGYYDGTVLFGQVLRERILSQRPHRASVDVPLSDSPFINVSFYGMYNQWQPHNRREKERTNFK